MATTFRPMTARTKMTAIIDSKNNNDNNDDNNNNNKTHKWEPMTITPQQQ